TSRPDHTRVVGGEEGSPGRAGGHASTTAMAARPASASTRRAPGAGPAAPGVAGPASTTSSVARLGRNRQSSRSSGSPPGSTAMSASVTAPDGLTIFHSPRTVWPAATRGRNGTGRGRQVPSSARKAARSAYSHRTYRSHVPVPPRGVTTRLTVSPTPGFVGATASANGDDGSPASAAEATATS